MLVLKDVRIKEENRAYLINLLGNGIIQTEEFWNMSMQKKILGDLGHDMPDISLKSIVDNILTPLANFVSLVL